MADKTTGLKIQVDLEAQKAAKEAGVLDQSIDDVVKSAGLLNEELKDTEAAVEAAAKDLGALEGETKSAGKAAQDAADDFALLGGRSIADLRKQADDAKAAFKRLEDSGEHSLEEIARAGKLLDKQLEEIEREIKDVDRAADKVDGGGLKALAGAIGVGVAVAAAKEVIMLADGYTSLDAKIKLVTDSAQEQALVNNILYQQSQDNRELVEGNAAAYSKLQLSLRDVGVQSSETLNIVDLVGKSLKVSGASAEEASSFQLQFAQAMGSGVLQGDELRAMLESNSYFGSQLAKALDTDIAGLREMGSAGELTTDRLREAFPAMAEQIEKDFAQMPVTIQEAVNTVVNAFGRIINEGNKSADGTGAVAEAIVNLGRVVEQNQDSIAQFFEIIVKGAELSVQGISGLIGIINTMQSGINSLQGGMARQAQSWALLTDKIGLTKNAAETWGLVAEEAAKKGEEAAGRATKSFAAMAGEQQQAAGKTTDALKKELVALEQVDSATAKAGDNIPAIKKNIADFADASGTLETTWQQIDGVWQEVLPDGTVLLDKMTTEIISGQDAAAGLKTTVKNIGGVWQEVLPDGTVLTAALKQEMIDAAGATKQLGAASEQAGKKSGLSAKEAEKAWKEYLKTVSTAADQLEQRTGISGLSEELADLKATQLSAAEGYQQMKDRVTELGAAAKSAFEEAEKLTAAGKDEEAAAAYEKALEYADEAKDKAKELNGAVEDGDKVIVSQTEAYENAKTAVTEYGNLGIEILEKWKEASQEAADTLDSEFNFSGLNEQAEQAAETAGKVGESLAEGVKGGVADALPEVASLDAALDEAARDRTATITITERTVQAALHGAQIMGRDLRAGAMVSGPVGYDSVHAILAGREAVTRNKIVDELGYNETFRPLNQGRYDIVMKRLAAFHGPDETRQILSAYLRPPEITMPLLPEMPRLDPPAQGRASGRDDLPKLGTLELTIGPLTIPVQARVDHVELFNQQVAAQRKQEQLKARAQGRGK